MKKGNFTKQRLTLRKTTNNKHFWHPFFILVKQAVTFPATLSVIIFIAIWFGPWARLPKRKHVLLHVTIKAFIIKLYNNLCS